MRIVLLLTGTCGVGKSTTARAWAARRGGANVSGDEIRHWMRDLATRRASDYQHELVARIAATAAEEFLGLGLDVALDFVWKPLTLRLLRDRLAPHADVRMVRLVCEPTENRRRDAERPANVVMGPRCDELRAELDAFTDWPTELRRIDTTALSLDAVLAAIDPPLDAAIAAEVDARWTGRDADEAIALLASYGTASHEREVDRVRRAILKLSGGELARLRHHLSVARIDYRNVLMWADGDA